ncbi:MAG TPA: hypothetical protein VIU11_24295 [Nakamurella sp.]
MIRQNLAASVTSIAVEAPGSAENDGPDCDYTVEGAVRSCEGDLGIEVNPAPLRCDAAGCPAVTVTGIGSAPLHVTKVEIEEDPASLLDVDQAGADMWLGTGESCQITITRTDVAVDGDFQACLVVGNGAGGSIASVPIRIAGSVLAGYDLVASADDLSCLFTPSSSPGMGGRLGVGFGFKLVGGDVSDLPGPVSIRGASKSGDATHYHQVPGEEAVTVAEFSVPARGLGSTQDQHQRRPVRRDRRDGRGEQHRGRDGHPSVRRADPVDRLRRVWRLSHGNDARRSALHADAERVLVRVRAGTEPGPPSKPRVSTSC